MQLTIRRARPGDESILTTQNAFVQALHRTHEPEHFASPDRADVEGWFHALLLSPASAVWIASVRDDVVGYVVAIERVHEANPFSRERRWIEIDQLGVRPDWRRQGIARALVQEVLREAASREVTDVEISSWAWNTEAHDVFAALGFERKVVRFRRR